MSYLNKEISPEVVKFRENMIAAHTARNDSSSVFLMFRNKAQEELGKISSDNTLSDEGKRLKSDALKREMRLALADVSKEVKQRYVSHLKEAKNQAEKIVSKLPKPTEQDAKAFQARVKEIGIQLALSPNGQIAKRRLDEFFEGIDNDITAQLARESYAELVGPAIAKLGGENAGQASIQYGTFYDTLATKFKTEEYVEAQRVIESASQMETSTIFSLIAEESAKGLLGTLAVNALRDPENYVEASE